MSTSNAWLGRGRVRPRARAMAALASLGFAVAAIVMLHGLRSGLDPASHTISDYAHGPYAWLATLALLALGVGGLAVASVLRATARAPRAAVLVALFGAGVLTAALFPVPAPGQGDTVAGDVHAVAAAVAFVSLALAMVLFADAFRADRRWRGLALPSRAGGLAALVLLLGGNGIATGARGTFERIYLGLLILWLVAVALRVVANGGDARRVGSARR